MRQGRGSLMLAALLCCAACAPDRADSEAQRPALGEERALNRAEAMLDSRAPEPAPPEEAEPTPGFADR